MAQCEKKLILRLTKSEFQKLCELEKEIQGYREKNLGKMIIIKEIFN